MPTQELKLDVNMARTAVMPGARVDSSSEGGKNNRRVIAAAAAVGCRGDEERGTWAKGIRGTAAAAGAHVSSSNGCGHRRS